MYLHSMDNCTGRRRFNAQACRRMTGAMTTPCIGSAAAAGEQRNSDVRRRTATMKNNMQPPAVRHRPRADFIRTSIFTKPFSGYFMDVK